MMTEEGSLIGSPNRRYFVARPIALAENWRNDCVRKRSGGRRKGNMVSGKLAAREGFALVSSW